MQVFNDFYDFFGFELLSDTTTFIDLINNLVQIGLGLFIVCFFIKAVFSLILNIFNYKYID